MTREKKNKHDQKQTFTVISCIYRDEKKFISEVRFIQQFNAKSILTIANIKSMVSLLIVLTHDVAAALSSHTSCLSEESDAAEL